MKRRTANIIMLTKGHHPFGMCQTYGEVIAKYMAETCACDEKAYTRDVLLGIVRTAVLDYIKTADDPAAFLYDYFEAAKREDAIEAWCSAFALTQVRNSEKGCFVNGFTEETLTVISENTGEVMYPSANACDKEG